MRDAFHRCVNGRSSLSFRQSASRRYLVDQITFVHVSLLNREVWGLARRGTARTFDLVHCRPDFRNVNCENPRQMALSGYSTPENPEIAGDSARLFRESEHV